MARDVLAAGLKDVGKNSKETKPTPTLPDMSPATLSDEKTDVVRGQTNVKHPPPPPAVNVVDGLDDVTQIIFRSFIVLCVVDGFGCPEQSRERRERVLEPNRKEMSGSRLRVTFENHI